MDGLQRNERKKFLGQFDALTKYGTDIPVIRERYKPLSGNGKPLWEFKEHDHRLYCARTVVDESNVVITLFNGWTKDKEGRTRREDTEIARAQTLYHEFSAEKGGQQ